METRSPPPSGPRMADGGKLYASCGNCSNLVENRCSLGQVPNNGELLCDLYTITPDFRDAIVEVMLGDLLKEVASTAVKVEKIRAARRFWN